MRLQQAEPQSQAMPADKPPAAAAPPAATARLVMLCPLFTTAGVGDEGKPSIAEMCTTCTAMMLATAPMLEGRYRAQGMQVPT
jgi:hypothetical protein